MNKVERMFPDRSKVLKVRAVKEVSQLDRFYNDNYTLKELEQSLMKQIMEHSKRSITTLPNGNKRYEIEVKLYED